MTPAHFAEAWLPSLSQVWSHLLQSTFFAAVAALLALALRTTHARARCWLWLAASVKFLVPFSALIAIGKDFAWHGAYRVPRFALTIIWEQAAHPLSRRDILLTYPASASTALSVLPPILLGIWFCGVAAIVFRWWLGWLRIRAAVHEATPLMHGRELEALRRFERIAGLRRPIGLRSSTGRLEPGVFGILRPVLLWPAGISDRLADAQAEAIIAHEVCHVRRRDNLAASVHMLVEAVFWFHPLVWWLGTRLVDERERACDEEVLGLGNEPEVYAESILKTCKFYVELPLVCVSGVTGSDLKKRIERIMTYRISKQLDFGRKLLLAAAAFSAIAGPIAFGVLSAPSIRAQSKPESAAPSAFEVASIKPNTSADHRTMFRMTLGGGRLSVVNISAQGLITMAYSLKPNQLSGAPGWLASTNYDIEAKAGDGPADPDKMKLMMQTLLADRFKLAIHRETKEMTVYALMAGKNISKLHPAADSGDGQKSQFRIGRGQLNLQSSTMAQLADALSKMVGRNVIDRTGIPGSFDIKLEWTPDPSEGGVRAPDGPKEDTAAVADTGPSIFTAIQEQLGLKLEGQKGPVEVVVIDHVEKASGN